jgi:hypothetical protein
MRATFKTQPNGKFSVDEVQQLASHYRELEKLENNALEEAKQALELVGEILEEEKNKVSEVVAAQQEEAKNKK